MLKNYFKVAWRNILRNKVFSIINVAGLAIGMAACILILLFVFYERSFDDFHKKNIYRLNEVQKFPGMLAAQKVALSMFPMGPTLQSEFPEVKNYARIIGNGDVPMNYKDKRIFMKSLLMVDSTFLQMFDFKILKGDKSTALQKPRDMVLTEATARKLFGNEDPIGKTVTNYGNDTTDFVVTAVLRDIPGNSHLQFDGLFSISTIPASRTDWMKNWGGNWLNTYLELTPNANVAALEKRFPAYLKKYMSEGDNWKNYELFLLPLKEMHAGTSDIGLDENNYKKFDSKYTKIFFVIALIVLAIACINFMNLSTARSAERAKEVGIRKTVGAERIQLSMQFISESILVSLISLVLASLLVKLCLPFVNNLSQRDLTFPIFTNPTLLITLIVGTVLLGVISGLYPAAYLSSFRPVTVLKGSVQTGKKKSVLLNSLVVAQFSSAIFLIIATFFAVRQLNYMQNRNPGFDREQIINISLRGASPKFDVMKQELLKNTLVTSVTGAQDELGSHLDQSGILFKGDSAWRDLTSTRLIVDKDYLNVYKIQVVAGRNFSNENGKEYIINETLAKELLGNSKAPMTSLLGKIFGFDSTGTIVGIAKDFNFNSLHYKIETMFMYNQKEWGFSKMSVKINESKAKEALAFIQSVWDKNVPARPFNYEFLTDHFTEVYRADDQVSSIVGILAALAIVVSCLGLFGLSSYAAEKRTREIGIRKTLGATVENIVGMLSKDFIKLVIIATLIAWPISWYYVHHWLQDYEYRVNISWWVFAIAALLAVLIAFITISYQAIKAALANPVKSLRTE